MAICPSEHMHLLLQALKDNDREGVTIYLAEMLLWLVVAIMPTARRPSLGVGPKPFGLAANWSASSRPGIQSPAPTWAAASPR